MWLPITDSRISPLVLPRNETSMLSWIRDRSRLGRDSLLWNATLRDVLWVSSMSQPIAFVMLHDELRVDANEEIETGK